MLTVMLLQNFIAHKFPIVQLLVHFSEVEAPHTEHHTLDYGMVWLGLAFSTNFIPLDDAEDVFRS